MNAMRNGSGTGLYPDAQVAAAMRAALDSLAYAAPELRMTILWEKLVLPLVRRAQIAEAEALRLHAECTALAAWAAGEDAGEEQNTERGNKDA